MKPFRKTLMAVGVAAACCSGIADASHFRGAAMVPSVDSSGLLTVTSISFWRNQTTHTGSDPFDAFPIAGIDDGGDPSVSGVGTMTAVGSDSGATGFAARTIENNSVAAFTFGSPATASATGWHRADAGLDSRYSKVTQTHTIQLTGAGTYDISAGSCCRVAGMANTGSTAWNMESSIFWDGATANTPIVFDFSNIQQEVVRGQDYNGNVGAVAGGGVTLSYDNALNTNIVSQPPGYVLDPVTGDMFIPSANTATYVDNTSGQPGADYAHSGHVFASDGSSVEFEWTFDAVNTASNTAPVVQNVTINALIGSTVSHTMLATDDGLPDPPAMLSNWELLSFVGVGGATISLPALFDAATQLFTWDTSGSTAPGTYQAFIRTSDSQLTDVGTITINLSNNGSAPLPATLPLLGIGLVGLTGLARRRRKLR